MLELKGLLPYLSRHSGNWIEWTAI